MANAERWSVLMGTEEGRQFREKVIYCFLVVQSKYVL